MATSIEELRTVAAAVHERRPDWQLGEVLMALRRVLVRDPETTPELLMRDACRIAESPSARSPWTLTGAGGVESRTVDRLVEPPRMLSAQQPPPVRDVIGPDPYRGNEERRADVYARGAAAARESLAAAARVREAEQVVKDAERAAERLQMAESEAAARAAEAREVVDW